MQYRYGKPGNSPAEAEVYLITYSRENLTAFPSREIFATAIVNAFEKSTAAKVLYWVVSAELHNDCDEERGTHYHMAVKLTKKMRWANVPSFLDKEFHIQVNFSAVHSTYYSAYRYTLKEDAEALFSGNHPDLSDKCEPRTEKAISVRKRKGKQTGGAAKSKKTARKRMSVYDVTQLIQTRGITSRLELVALAVQQLEKQISPNSLPVEAKKPWMTHCSWRKNSRRPKPNLQGAKKVAWSCSKKLTKAIVQVNARSDGYSVL